jgi:ABC-type glutathione transport system ATPase component
VLVPNGAFFTIPAAIGCCRRRQQRQRAVQLGCRNDFIEVLDGLKPGERVITSTYSGLVDKDHPASTPANRRNTSMLTMTGLTKTYRTDSVETTALDAIDHITKGEFVAIMGPSAGVDPAQRDGHAR